MDRRHIGKWRLEIENAMICFINFLWKLLNWFSEGKYELHLSAPIKTLAAHQMIKLLQGMHLLFKLRISNNFELMAEKKHTKKHWSCYLYQALSFTRLVDLNYELRKTIFMKIYFSFEKMKNMVFLGKDEICCCCEKKMKNMLSLYLCPSYM